MATTTVLHHFQVGPPPPVDSTTSEQILPLTYFDLVWLHFHPIQRLLFYKFPCSKSHFLETIVPSLKTSLSKTLKHYRPLSGNLYYPTTDHDSFSNMPQLRYKPGDSVSVTVAEYSGEHCEEDFNYLTGDSQRDCDRFYPFFTDLADPKTEPGYQLVPLFAVQITLFPGVGICLGFNNDHVVGDASSIVGFIKAWSKVTKFGPELSDDDDGESLINIPFYDRSVVTDPKGISDIYWNYVKNRIYAPRPAIIPKNKVRATYILKESDITKLKNMVRSKKPHLTHLSSFTITTAYVWACTARSASSSEAVEEQVSDNEPEHFAFAVDTRPRVDPPLPANYFGNCVGAAFVETTHADLKGEDGFSTAVELIGNVIANKVMKKDEFLSDADGWLDKFYSLVDKRLFGVAGSPKFDLYDADFGWGKPNKYEALSIDGEGSISLCKSREFEGGLEIGLSLPKKKMDVFAECFYSGLEIS